MTIWSYSDGQLGPADYSSEARMPVLQSATLSVTNQGRKPQRERVAGGKVVSATRRRKARYRKDLAPYGVRGQHKSPLFFIRGAANKRMDLQDRPNHTAVHAEGSPSRG